MKVRSLLGIGIIGTAVTALCCFTPVLVVLLGVVGLSALTGYLDFVLFPALFFFAGLTIFAFIGFALDRRSILKEPTDGSKSRND